MRTMNKLPLIIGIAGSMLLLASCKKDKEDPVAPTPVNEEELITSVYLRMWPTMGGDTAVFSFVDLDGDGGSAPVIVGDTLMPNTIYSSSILLLNESEMPVDTISNEVAQEAEAHQFFFSTTGGSLSWTAYSDADMNGDPIGLSATWNTAMSAGSGDLSVVLRHELDKSAVGVGGGDITNAGGETDIEVTIPYM
ncbi:MAG: hypothetical protein KDB88_03060, partial [Flavobacteriales bacterium]|nr:hypothetical protein [Flavobacteriales bacterium]